MFYRAKANALKRQLPPTETIIFAECERAAKNPPRLAECVVALMNSRDRFEAEGQRVEEDHSRHPHAEPQSQADLYENFKNLFDEVLGQKGKVEELREQRPDYFQMFQKDFEMEEVEKGEIAAEGRVAADTASVFVPTRKRGKSAKRSSRSLESAGALKSPLKSSKVPKSSEFSPKQPKSIFPLPAMPSTHRNISAIPQNPAKPSKSPNGSPRPRRSAGERPALRNLQRVRRYAAMLDRINDQMKRVNDENARFIKHSGLDYQYKMQPPKNLTLIDQISKLIDSFKMASIGRKETDAWIDTLLEMSGAAKTLDQTLRRMEPQLKAVERELYPRMLELERWEKSWRRVRETYSSEQRKRIDEDGYAFLSAEQMGLIYKSPLAPQLSAEAKEFAKMSVTQREHRLEADIRQLATLSPERFAAFERRRRRSADGLMAPAVARRYVGDGERPNGSSGLRRVRAEESGDESVVAISQNVEVAVHEAESIDRREQALEAVGRGSIAEANPFTGELLYPTDAAAPPIHVFDPIERNPEPPTTSAQPTSTTEPYYPEPAEPITQSGPEDDGPTVRRFFEEPDEVLNAESQLPPTTPPADYPAEDSTVFPKPKFVKRNEGEVHPCPESAEENSRTEPADSLERSQTPEGSAETLQPPSPRQPAEPEPVDPEKSFPGLHGAIPGAEETSFGGVIPPAPPGAPPALLDSTTSPFQPMGPQPVSAELSHNGQPLPSHVPHHHGEPGHPLFGHAPEEEPQPGEGEPGGEKEELPEFKTLAPFAFGAKINEGVVLEGLTLSPYAFFSEIAQPEALSFQVLSPRAFIPSILSPAALVARVLSPAAFRAEILSPRALVAWVLTPEALIAEVLSPKAIETRILSPEALIIQILSPNTLAPKIYSPEALGVVILSPSFLSPRIMSGEKMVVEVLSPNILGGSEEEPEEHEGHESHASHEEHGGHGHLVHIHGFGIPDSEQGIHMQSGHGLVDPIRPHNHPEPIRPEHPPPPPDPNSPLRRPNIPNSEIDANPQPSEANTYRTANRQITFDGKFTEEEAEERMPVPIVPDNYWAAQGVRQMQEGIV